MSKLNQTQSETIEQLESTLKEKESKIRHLDKVIKEREDKIFLTESTIAYLKDKISHLENRKPVEEDKVLFYAQPDWQGKFLSTSGTKHPKKGASLYKFHLSEDAKEAEFEFYYNATTFESAINNPGVKIAPVCLFSNDFKENAKGIKTLKRGRVLLKSTHWELVEKAEIQFI